MRCIVSNFLVPTLMYCPHFTEAIVFTHAKIEYVVHVILTNCSENRIRRTYSRVLAVDNDKRAKD